jgi:hypothetical protein
MRLSEDGRLFLGGGDDRVEVGRALCRMGTKYARRSTTPEVCARAAGFGLAHADDRARLVLEEAGCAGRLSSL